MSTIAERAVAYGARPEISARSLLVTVFGDSIAPAGGKIWLGDLIKLIEPFAFSERLIRTSIYRLSAEGWFDTERVGRRSRYSLSAVGQHEFAAAERRIYHPPTDDWNGEWTIVFVNADHLADDTKSAFVTALRWLGFGRLATGVFGSPTATPDVVESAATRATLDVCPPTATAQFSDLAGLVDQSSFAADFGIDASVASYKSFIAEWDGTQARMTQDGQDAFLLRTMLVDDFRRARLSDTDLPGSLLPSGWAGRDAYRVAAEIFEAVDPIASSWLAERWGLLAAPIDRFPLISSAG